MNEIPDWQAKRIDEELRDMRKALSEVVPRREHELIWKMDRDARDHMQEQLKDLAGTVKELGDELRSGQNEIRALISENETARLGGQMPRWFLPFIAVVMPVLTTIAVHFWK